MQLLIRALNSTIEVKTGMSYYTPSEIVFAIYLSRYDSMQTFCW